MNINPITMTTNCMKKSVNFGEKKQEIKPLIQIDENTPDDKVVSYGTWGANYAYPITAGQLRAARKLSEHGKNPQVNNVETEDSNEYYKRKLYSTEWTM